MLGAEPYPADTLDFLIRAAASAIQAGEDEQPSVNTALQFLSLLKSVNQTALSNRLTQVFEDELAYSQIGTRRGPEYTSEVLLLSLSAGLPQAVYGAFALVRENVLAVLACMSDPALPPLGQKVKVWLQTSLGSHGPNDHLRANCCMVCRYTTASPSAATAIAKCSL